MVKEQKITGLSPDFIIHPGETLQEIMEENNMTQKELAIRTGMTEKHISTVVNGLKPISVAFAKKLEYVFEIEDSFWINLQSNYDRELQDFNEANQISPEELSVLKRMKHIIEYYNRLGFMHKEENAPAQVLEMRRLMNISNLINIPKLEYKASYRAQTQKKIDPYILYAWQRTCELLTRNNHVSNIIDIDKLKSKLPEIKKVMFCRADQIQNKLEKIFAECGIIFKIVRHFQGAPVQGFIKMTNSNQVILCMTIRQSFADIFWFTLFHEVGHILNGDYKNTFVDFDSVKTVSEKRADEFAGNYMIPQEAYEKFIKESITLDTIKIFAQKCEIPSFIVIGRLMKDGIIQWNKYSSERIRYKWVD